MPDSNSKTELTTWQEIAAYLGVSDRTAQTWARKHGLPISRIGGRVVAVAAELDRWKQEQRELNAPPPEEQPAAVDQPTLVQSPAPPPNSEPPRRPWKWKRSVIITWLALIVVSGTALFATISWFGQRQLSKYVIEGRLLTIFDERNRKIWDYVFPEPAADGRLTGPQYDQFRQKFADIDGDGNAEFLIGVNRTLYCFSSSGRILWTHRMGREVLSQSIRVPADYGVTIIGALSQPNRDGGRIIVGGHRGPGALFLVELLTAEGKKVGEYFHFGWFFGIATGELEPGHEDIFLAGVDGIATNSSDYGATLVVLDPDRFGGQASTLAVNPHALKDVPAASEKALLLIREFAPSPEPHHFCRGRDISIGTAFPLELTVRQGENQPYAHFRFDQNLQVVDVTPELKLLAILKATLLTNVPPPDFQRVITQTLGDIRYVRNQFAH